MRQVRIRGGMPNLRGECAAGRWVASCEDDVKNGGETDVDCGGSQCPLCPAGRACSDFSECASQRCVDAQCLDTACEDEVMNGTEIDIGCGGDCETKCPLNGGCRYVTDCATGGA